MVRFILVLVLGFLGISCSAAAEEEDGYVVVGSCNHYKQSTADYGSCLITELKRLEPTLERYVQAQRDNLRAAVATVSADTDTKVLREPLEAALQQFNAAQTAWVAYREAHCAMVEKQYTNGSGSYAAKVACQIRLTKSRLHEIWRDGQTKLPEPA